MFVRVRYNKTLVFVSASAAALLAFSGARAEPRRFDLPAQPAAASIPQFARQAGLQILAPETLTRGVRTQPVSGVMIAAATM